MQRKGTGWLVAQPAIGMSRVLGDLPCPNAAQGGWLGGLATFAEGVVVAAVEDVAVRAGARVAQFFFIGVVVERALAGSGRHYGFGRARFARGFRVGDLGLVVFIRTPTRAW